MSVFSLIDSTFIQGTGSGNAITSPSKNFSGANLVAAIVGCYAGTIDATYLTDTSSNAYTMSTLRHGAGDSSLNCAIFWKISPTFDGTDQLIFTPAGGVGTFPGMVVFAWTCGGAPTLVTQVGNGSSLSTGQAGSIGNAGDLVIQGAGEYALVSPGNPTINSSFSSPVNAAYQNGQNIGAHGSWLEVGGAVNPTWTYASATEQAMVAVSFAPPAGGGGGNPWSYYAGHRRR